MDLGTFKRSKLVFAAWLLMPLVVVVGIDLGAAGFCYITKRRLVQDREMLRAIDGISTSHRSVSEALLKILKSQNELPSTPQEVSSWLDEIAPESEFTVENLSVVKSTGAVAAPRSSMSKRRRKMIEAAKGPPSLPSIRVTLKGRGSYVSLVRLLRDLETGYALVHVAGIRVVKNGSGEADSYLCELTFNIYLIEA